MKKITRILALVMSALMVLGVAGCNSKEDEWEEYSVYEDVDDIPSAQTNTGTKSDKDAGSEKASSKQIGSNKKINKKTTKKITKKVVKATDKADEGLINAKKLSPQEELFAKASLKGTTLTYVKGSEDVYPQEEYAIKMLKEKWGINVKYQVFANTALPNMVATMVASGNPPDVAHVADTNMLRYAYTNLATPLNDYLAVNDPVWDNGECFEPFTFNGKIYGISWSSPLNDNYFVWYNKTYLDEVGAEDPYTLYKKGKWDVDAFKRVAKKCVQFESDGKTVKTYGAMCWNPSLFLALYGEQAITEKPGNKWKVTIDSEAGMKGLQLIHDMYANSSLKLEGGYKEFGKRGTAMLIERPVNAIGNYDYYNTMEDEIGMVPLPSTSYGSYGFTNTDGTFILKGSKNPMAAVAYRYYDRLFVSHTSNKEKEKAGYRVDKSISISDEHKAVAEEYFAKKRKKSLDSKLYSLTNWQSGENISKSFWNGLTVDGKQPAQLVDSAKSQIIKCLKDTVGASNVVN